ncbi:translation initiation factor IF-2 [Anaerolineales bacterium HSG6]|nr:translation initiation factor IF-2 [Anaerolineales bacterium HSG6]MDM8533003.1 translation initiation factor IF-2 [Anaerolineales bacterium HSG25]
MTKTVQQVNAKNGKAIEVPPSISVRDLAALMSISAIDIIKELMSNGIMANINQQIDFDTVSIIGEEMGFEIVSPQVDEQEQVEVSPDLPLHRQLIAQEDPKSLRPRPPVVTVLGHVDHGKTTLLDTIREAEVAEGEAGGITQHIGAYQVHIDGRPITFLDTPGHEAFTAMRARGAQATDLAVLVVAADDGVMPQTKEAIEHARAAQVPILVAMNKIDKANANPTRVHQELADAGLVPEEWGGETTCIPVSAKEKIGIEDVLENILLITDVAELKANPNRSAQGVVIEGKVDRRRGVVANLLIQNGQLKQGDLVMIGAQYGKIKAMFNDYGKRIKKAGLSVPVSILGLSKVPAAGDFFEVVKNEKTARSLVAERQAKLAQQKQLDNTRQPISLEQFFQKRGETGDQTLYLIIRADVQGSVEPIVNSLNSLEVGDVKIKILSKGAGNISETDVNLAVASGAIIVGFNVITDAAAQKQADSMGIDIRLYNVIYKLIDDVEKALKGLLKPEYADKIIGRAQVRAIFKVPKKGQVAGSYIQEGKFSRNALVRVYRMKKVLHDGKLASLRRFTDDVAEVATGFECGIGVDGFNAFREGDILEAYIKERTN